MKPYLSIIIPVYNIRDYIINCLESLKDVRNNFYFEIIIINDGSNDGSLELVEEYFTSQNYLNYFIFSQTNQGVGSARNAGLNLANGHYVLFLDGDDLGKEEMVRHLETLLRKDNHYDIICFGYDKVDQSGNIIQKFEERFSMPFSTNSNWELLSKIVSGKYWIWTASALYSTEFLRENNISFTSHTRGEDLLFIFTSIIKSVDVKILRLSLMKYRVREGSVSRTLNPKSIDSIFAFLELIERCKSIVDFKNRKLAMNYSLYLSIRAYISQLSELNEKPVSFNLRHYQNAKKAIHDSITELLKNKSINPFTTFLLKFIMLITQINPKLTNRRIVSRVLYGSLN